MNEKIRVTVWNEGRHEKRDAAGLKIYPRGMHTVIAGFASAEPDIECRTATLDEPEHGLSEEVLEQTDVLTWWGHMAHDEVEDAVVRRVHKRVLMGMGLLVLHSGHYSNFFHSLMGTQGSLRWREIAEKERLWNIEPSHPITEGIGDYIELPHAEMYGERFDIPTPDKVIFISWFEGGEVFRSGACWERGYGRIFYFRPGHETYPIYHNREIQRVLVNAVRWARKRQDLPDPGCPMVDPLENVKPRKGTFD